MYRRLNEDELPIANCQLAIDDRAKERP